MITGKTNLTPKDLKEGGLNAPIDIVEQLSEFTPNTAAGVSRYSCPLGRESSLDALLVNKGSDVLVVSFHGALDRQRFTLPRFERLNSLKAHDVSSLYFTDPALYLDPTLELAWFTGWRGLDLYPALASWTVAAANAVGAHRIILTGSSGGGFAALQVSSLIPNSLAIPFNPQTAISAYLANGVMRGPQRKYVSVVMPELAPSGFDHLAPEVDWAKPLGAQLSTLDRYSLRLSNHVLYATNLNDFHHRDHFLPFVEAATRGGNIPRLEIYEYDGPVGHTPPAPNVFDDVLRRGVGRVRKLA